MDSRRLSVRQGHLVGHIGTQRRGRSELEANRAGRTLLMAADSDAG
jgi:hypothetical protein